MEKFKFSFLILICIFTRPISVKADGDIPAAVAPTAPVAVVPEGPVIPWDCAKVMAAIPDDALSQGLSRFSEIEAEVIAGAKIPGWSDFDALTSLISQFQAYQGKFDVGWQMGNFRNEISNLEALLVDQFHFDPNFTRIPLSSNYVPSGYELTQVYRYYLNELNEFFPNRAHFAFNDIPEPDISREQILDQAKAIVNIQKGRIEESLTMLDPTLKTWAEFEKRNLDWLKLQTPESGYPELYKVLSDPTKFVISMRRPENARFWLPMTGFQNQRVTGSSRGTLNNNFRDEYEARSFGINEHVYSQMRADLKPEYGYLRFDPSVPFALRDGATQYGDDIYDFDYEKVKPYLTFTIGDSLGNAYQIEQLTFGRSMTPIQYLRYSISTWQIQAADANGVHQVSLGGPIQSFSSPISFGPSYLETQKLGLDFLDYVKRFTFGKTPPAPDYVIELQSRGIQIFDGRNGAPKPWNGALTQRALPVSTSVTIRPPLTIPVMVAPSLVKPFTVDEAMILAVFPSMPASALKLNGDGYGVLQSDEMAAKGTAFIIQPGTNTPGNFIMLPVASDPHYFISGNELIYSITNSGTTTQTVSDFVSQNYYLFGNALYRSGPILTDANSEWSTNMDDFFPTGVKTPSFLRNLLKKQTSILMGGFLSQVGLMSRSDGLMVNFNVSQSDLETFKTTGHFDIRGNSQIATLRLSTPASSVSKLGALLPIDGSGFYAGIQNRVYSLSRPTDAADLIIYNARIQHFRAEISIIYGIVGGSTVDQVKAALAALAPGPCEIESYDTEDFRAVIQDFIDGKL